MLLMAKLVGPEKEGGSGKSIYGGFARGLPKLLTEVSRNQIRTAYGGHNGHSVHSPSVSTKPGVDI